MLINKKDYCSFEVWRRWNASQRKTPPLHCTGTDRKPLTSAAKQRERELTHRSLEPMLGHKTGSRYQLRRSVIATRSGQSQCALSGCILSQILVSPKNNNRVSCQHILLVLVILFDHSNKKRKGGTCTWSRKEHFKTPRIIKNTKSNVGNKNMTNDFKKLYD